MTAPEQRANALALLDEAVTSGARLVKACKILGIAARTVQRWRQRGREPE